MQDSDITRHVHDAFDGRFDDCDAPDDLAERARAGGLRRRKARRRAATRSGCRGRRRGTRNRADGPSVCTPLGPERQLDRRHDSTRREDGAATGRLPLDDDGGCVQGLTAQHVTLPAGVRRFTVYSNPNMTIWGDIYADPATGDLTYYSQKVNAVIATQGGGRVRATSDMSSVIGKKFSYYEVITTHGLTTRQFEDVLKAWFTPHPASLATP